MHSRTSPGKTKWSWQSSSLKWRRCLTAYVLISMKVKVTFQVWKMELHSKAYHWKWKWCHFTIFLSRPIIHVVREEKCSIQLEFDGIFMILSFLLSSSSFSSTTWIFQIWTKMGVGWGARNLNNNRLDIPCFDATHRVESHVGHL